MHVPFVKFNPRGREGPHPLLCKYQMHVHDHALRDLSLRVRTRYV